jgi:hypothetical protein
MFRLIFMSYKTLIKSIFLAMKRGFFCRSEYYQGYLISPHYYPAYLRVTTDAIIFYLYLVICLKIHTPIP